MADVIDQVFVWVLLAGYGVLAAVFCYGMGYFLTWLCWRLLLARFGTAHRGVILRVARFGTYAIGYDEVYLTVLLPDGNLVQAHSSISDLDPVDPGDSVEVLLPSAALARILPPGPRSRVAILNL